MANYFLVRAKWGSDNNKIQEFIKNNIWAVGNPDKHKSAFEKLDIDNWFFYQKTQR